MAQPAQEATQLLILAALQQVLVLLQAISAEQLQVAALLAEFNSKSTWRVASSLPPQ